MEREELLREQTAERKWLLDYSMMHMQRDAHIRHARELGVGVNEIADLVGMARQTVSNIIHGGRP